ncbi:MAG: hypothetical protein JOY54_14135 [Acidobacteriaceae bacterium]|nr:hypothetical protein [Acidobacteriaceae bacterium]
MVVRINWRKRRLGSAPKFQNAALAFASLLTPFALIAFTVTLWSLGAELKLTGKFFITGGFFSHWQVWLLSAAGLSLSAWLLNRYARLPRQDYAR